MESRRTLFSHGRVGSVMTIDLVIEGRNSVIWSWSACFILRSWNAKLLLQLVLFVEKSNVVGTKVLLQYYLLETVFK